MVVWKKLSLSTVEQVMEWDKKNNEKFITKDGYKLYSFNSTDEMYKWIERFHLEALQ